jgi:hypothetical protein
VLIICPGVDVESHVLDAIETIIPYQASQSKSAVTVK